MVDVVKLDQAGLRGAGAYDYWLAQGNVGTVQDFLDAQEAAAAAQVALAEAAAAAAEDAADTFRDVPSAIPGASWIDGDGNEVFGFDADTIRHPQIDEIASDVASLTGVNGAALTRLARLQGKRSDTWGPLLFRLLPQVAHLLIYGQSLAQGYNGVPVVSSPAGDFAKMFNGGLHTLSAGAGDRDSFVNLVETVDGSVGETIATGMAVMFAQLLAEEDGLDIEDLAQFLLMTDPAQGGTAIAGLGPATGPYIQAQADISAGPTAAAGLGYALAALCWLQGESDEGNATAAETWKTALRSIRTGLRDYAETVTSRDRELPVLLYQTSTLGGATVTGAERPQISLAQLDLTEEDYFALVAPTYALPYYGAGDIHLSAQGYRTLGAYFGVALKRWLWDGIKPQPLRPIEARRYDSSVIVSFDVFSGAPLVLDEDIFPSLDDFGFTMATSAGAAITITGVTLVGSDRVKLSTGGAVPAGAVVRYGWNGSSVYLQGALRDSAGDSMVFDPEGDATPMHNWCAIFEETAL